MRTIIAAVSPSWPYPSPAWAWEPSMLCYRVRVEPSVVSRLKRRIALALDAQGVVAKLAHAPARAAFCA